jgi:hypothetical protein
MTDDYRKTMTMSPFSRLAVVQATSVAGDVFLNVALVGSIFFVLDVNQARPKVLLYLVCTMLPFVLLSPLIGPALDRSRGGRRLVMAACAIGRAICLFTLSFYIDASGPASYFLFPLAFGALMFSKGHSIAKSSLVPAVVKGHQTFVKANSRLAIISVISGFVAAVPAIILFNFPGPQWALRVGAMVFVACGLLAFRIPKAPVVAPPLSEAAKEELHARSVVLSGTLMAIIRGVVGFLTLLFAFWIKTTDKDFYFFGIAGAAAAIGNVSGVLLAPVLRKHLREETILGGVALIAGVIALVLARGGGMFSLTVVACIVAIAAAAGRLAFDALVQRDAPDAARGRVFARYETRFQATWVLGAIIPVIPFTTTFSARVGLFFIAVVLVSGGLFYVGGLRGLRRTVGAGADLDAEGDDDAEVGDDEFRGLSVPEEPTGIDVALEDPGDATPDRSSGPAS